MNFFAHKLSVVVLAALFSAAGLAREEVIPVSGTEKKPGPAKPFRRRPPKVFWSKLSQEEREQIDQLARAGKKDELRRRMRELFHKYRPEEMKRLDVLSGRYLKSLDESERSSIRREMETLCRTLFRKRQDFTKNNIAETEKQLERAQQDLQRLKQHYQRNEANAEKIIADQVEQFCLKPEQRRKFGKPAGNPAEGRSAVTK